MSLFLLLLVPAALAAQTAPPRYRVIDETLAAKPVSPLLSSHFVELGYTYQIEPMMAEMLPWSFTEVVLR